MQNEPKFEADAMDAATYEAATVLKAMSNPGRLRIMCALVAGPMTVSEIEKSLGESQSYVSGQLLRLRGDGLVKGTRDGRVISYSLADVRVRPILERLYEVFCAD